MGGKEGQQELLGQVASLLCDYLRSQEDQSQPVSRLVDPEQLQRVFAEAGIPLGLKDSQASGSEELLAALRLALKYSVRTGHPKFLNQLYARADPISLAADWLVSALNCNVHTYEAAPVLTVIEVEVLAKLATYIGEPYTSSHDGLFVPGGSLSNYYGMHLARNQADPQYKQRGAQGGPCMVAFTSEHAHYSYLKAAFVTGLGTDNLISVACDASGAMLPQVLEQAIVSAKEKGKVPFFVGATAGTTVLGAFDPFQDIAAICARHNVWLHIDGAWGAACLLSSKHRHLMKGCERADSLAWNPHKLMGLPLQCAAFLTRHPGMLKACCGASASYLFSEDRLHAAYDLGDKTIQCGRRGDAFKLWLAWKAYGTAGYAAKVEHSFRLAEHFERAVQASGGKFVLVQPRSYVNVCFWWIPPPLRPFAIDSASQKTLDTLAQVTPAIKGKMQRAGDALINFQPLGSLPNFFRIVFASPLSIEEADLDSLLDRMDQYGQELWQSLSSPDLQPNGQTH